MAQKSLTESIPFMRCDSDTHKPIERQVVHSTKPYDTPSHIPSLDSLLIFFFVCLDFPDILCTVVKT